jgi:predicted nucleotidyltransferase
MVKLKIKVSQEKIAAFCQKHHIRKLTFFGSILRDDFRPDSDIDVLMEFQPGLSFFAMQDELSGNFGPEGGLKYAQIYQRLFQGRSPKRSRSCICPGMEHLKRKTSRSGVISYD